MLALVAIVKNRHAHVRALSTRVRALSLSANAPHLDQIVL